MLAPHPFGHEITRSFAERKICSISAVGRPIPPVNPVGEISATAGGLKECRNELSGCENSVWLGAEKSENGTLHFYGDSEGRIVKGLLAVLLTAIEGKTPDRS